MSSCQCKNGFFSLRDCGQPADATCELCKRAMCRAHSTPESGFTQCRDCRARNQQQVANDDPRTTNRNYDYDDGWAYNYRHRYYGAGYAPIYSGTHYHHYYDSYDTRSFDKREGDFDDGSDNARSGFSDS